MTTELEIIRDIQQLRNSTYKIKKELDGMLPSNRVLNLRIRILEILLRIKNLG